MAELLTRARTLVAAGPYGARTAEIATVHAALYPDRDAVCQTCRSELGRAFYAIQRWVEQQGAAGQAPISSFPMQKSIARFKSDSTIYTPHGLGVAYSNANLTDKAARDILAADPDARALFDVLPPAADSADNSDASSDAQPAATTSASATLPDGFDYAKLASALADELERRHGTMPTPTQPEQPAPAIPVLTASTGGTLEADTSADTADSAGTAADAAGDSEQDESKPVRLSRQNKEQLRATYAAELGSAPAEELTADELREAIATKRAGQASAE